MSPEKDPIFTAKVISFAFAMLLGLWGILTKRVFDLPKDHADRISAVPHPFVDYWDKDPATDGLEVVLVDLSITNTKKWISDNRKIGKGILEDLGTVVKGKGKNKTHSDYNIPNIPKFSDKIKIIEP